MIVYDLDGNQHKWSILGNSKNTRKNQSSLHKAANAMLAEIYPTLTILQEVPIVVRKNHTLYLDFYLPLLKRAIEVHGEQHYKFVAHYHSNAMGFMKHKKRDIDKKEWCELNGIEHIELPYNESVEEWKLKIKP